jgi:hypothetical protein
MLKISKKKKKSGSVFDKKYFNRHEEHAILLFVLGILFGLGMGLYSLQGQVSEFSVVSIFVVLVVLYFIETRC